MISEYVPRIMLRQAQHDTEFLFIPNIPNCFLRVISSVGRASPLQGEGRQFEPVITHQASLLRATPGTPVPK